MLIELGKYEPFGQKFMESRPHLGEESTLNPVIDFSAIDFISPRLTPPSAPQFHNLFSISDNLTIDIGDSLDERKLDQFGKVENPAIELEQEIYVKGSTVIWSRAGYVMKTFDYSAEDQPIQQVLFAWFPVHSISDPTNKPALDTVPNDLDGDKQYVDGYWDKKGPQSIINFNTSTSVIDDTNYIPAEKSTIEENNHQLQRRTLCIVFQNCIKIHCEDGLNVTSHIPFDIGDVVPLDIGLLVSRKYVPAEKNTNKKGKGKPSLSTLAAGGGLSSAAAAGTSKIKKASVNFASTTTIGGSEFSSFFVTVTHPLRGTCPVKLRDATHTGISNLPEPLTSPQKLLFATTKSSDTGRLPVIVTLNIKENKHCIWTYERRREKNQPSSTVAALPTSATKRKSSMSARNTPTMVKKKLAKSTHNNNPPSTPNRNKKQKSFILDSPSRSYAQFHEDYESDEEKFHENELEKDVYNELLDPSEISLRLLWREYHGPK
jgi:hypothetical protein